jgi:uncharacterized cupin superfamily protein
VGVNLYRSELQRDDDDLPGFEIGYLRLGSLLGAEKIGATIYELTTGQSICPYHYEYPNEEWLIVLSGQPVLRTPDGEREVEPGDVVCFSEGPAGAHKVTNRREEPARVLMLSTKLKPDVSVYPDSAKVGIWPGNEDDQLILPRSAAVGYYEGEVGER